MKLIKFITVLTAICTLFLTSCSESELNSVNPLLDEIEGYELNFEDGSKFYFDTQEEVLGFLKNEDQTKYEATLENFNFINSELKIIDELDLKNKPEGHSDVLDYANKFEIEEEIGQAHVTSRGTLQWGFFDPDFDGKVVWIPGSNPKMKVKNRNKFSSIQAGSGVVLCSKLWWGGTHKLYFGSHSFIGWTMNDDAESYYSF